MALLCDLGSKVTDILGPVSSSVKPDVVGAGGDSAGAREVVSAHRVSIASEWWSAPRVFLAFRM